LLVAAAALAAAAVVAPAAPAATPDQIVARLNAERTANGIPGGIVLDPAWTLGCEHHIRYEELNGIRWTHEEVPGKPGFTKDGQFAGIAGDQAYNGSFDTRNPFDTLPLHLANLLQPTLARVGAFERGGRTCIRIVPGNTRRIARNAIYGAAAGGRARVPASERVHGEWPASPGDVVGLPQGTTTGPTIYVFASGPWLVEQPLKLTQAGLVGPEGRVSIRSVSPAVRAKIRPYVAPGVFFLIPVSPLRRHTGYTATVTVASVQGTKLIRSWRFVTAG
jgi:hypothetical protein